MTDQGTVQSVTGNEIVLRRANGSDITIQVDQTSMTLPEKGDSVQVIYQFQGTTTPSAVSIKKQ